jgi:hypothetical protein
VAGYEDDDQVVRPYLMTGGRTRPVTDGLRVETLVFAKPAALHAPLKYELRSIVELCQTPRSMAEIAGVLRIPLGVAQVLVADLVTSNIVTIQEATEVTIGMLERILDRVRAL